MLDCAEQIKQREPMGYTVLIYKATNGAIVHLGKPQVENVDELPEVACSLKQPPRFPGERNFCKGCRRPCSNLPIS